MVNKSSDSWVTMNDFPSTSRGPGRRGLFETFLADNESTAGSDMDIDSSESNYDIPSDPFASSSSDSENDAAAARTPRAAKRQRGADVEAAGQPPQDDSDVPDWIPVQPPEPVANPATKASFLPRNVGPRNAPPRNSQPIAYIDLFLNKDLLVHIVRETNRYANAFLTDDAVREWIRDHPNSRFKKWPSNGISVALLKKYFGLSINMGLVQKKRLSDYWSTQSSQATPYFNAVMPFWLFSLINRMIHVNDNTTEVPRGEDGFDPWHKVRPVLDQLNDAFKHHYVPSENVSIDESMIGMKNRIVYIQYMPNKRHARFGIKKFELCDSNGYVYHMELYAGKDFDIRHDEGQAHGVVMTLMRKSQLLNKGYHLYTDNFYTKPHLAEVLHQNDTYLTGGHN